MNKQRSFARSRTQRTRTASRQRREQEKEELRQTILAAAAALFLEHGYEAFSLRQVAEQIGYSPTTIYLHFEDKTDLLFAVVDNAYAEFSRRLQAAYNTTTDALARIRALGQAYVDFGLANPVIFRIDLHAPHRLPHAVARWRGPATRHSPADLAAGRRRGAAGRRHATAGDVWDCPRRDQANAGCAQPGVGEPGIRAKQGDAGYRKAALFATFEKP